MNTIKKTYPQKILLILQDLKDGKHEISKYERSQLLAFGLVEREKAGRPRKIPLKELKEYRKTYFQEYFRRRRVAQKLKNYTIIQLLIFAPILVNNKSTYSLGRNESLG
jgi:hypothetical protein